MSSPISISTKRKIHLYDITSEIEGRLRERSLDSGICMVYCPHTTAGLVINEAADPDVASDLERAFAATVPSVRFDHAEGNSPAHYLSCLTGSSLSIPVENGRLGLGRWQGVFFCEFDGPRERQIHISFIGS